MLMSPLTHHSLRAGHAYNAKSEPGLDCHSNEGRQEEEQNVLVLLAVASSGDECY